MITTPFHIIGINLQENGKATVNMTTENNITITMQDVDVVMALNPEFKKQILIAATSRGRTEVTQKIEKEATEKAKK